MGMQVEAGRGAGARIMVTVVVVVVVAVAIESDRDPTPVHPPLLLLPRPLRRTPTKLTMHRPPRGSDRIPLR